MGWNVRREHLRPEQRSQLLLGNFSDVLRQERQAIEQRGDIAEARRCRSRLSNDGGESALLPGNRVLQLGDALRNPAAKCWQTSSFSRLIT